MASKMRLLKPTYQKALGTAGEIFLIAAIYWLTSLFGLKYATVHAKIAPIWPPSGIALAVLFLRGWRLWPGVFIGGFLANMTAGPNPLWVPLLVAIGNTSQGLLGYAIFKKLIPIDPHLERIRDVVTFIVGSMLAVIPAAIVGPVALALAQGLPSSSLPRNIVFWFMGDLLGIIVLTPLFLNWFSKPRPKFKLLAIAEFTVVAIIATFIVHWTFFSPGGGHRFFILLPLTWVSLRYGQRAATLSVVLFSALAILLAPTHIAWSDQRQISVFMLAFQTHVAVVGTVMYLIAAGVAAEGSRRYYDERVRLLSELEGERQRLQHLVQQVPGMVWEMWFNPSDPRALPRGFVSEYMETMLGYSPLELRKAGFRQWLKVFHPDDLDHPLIQTLLNPKNALATSGRYRLVAKDGRTVWVHTSISISRDEQGRVCGIRGLTLDISAQKRLEDEREELLRSAQQAIKAREEILAIVSHDLRSPLSSINMNAGFLQRSLARKLSEAKDSQLLVSCSDMIMSSVDHMNRLINDLLDAAKIEFGRLPIEMQTISASDFLEGAVELMESLARDKSQSVELQLPKERIEVPGDTERLRQAFVNLIGNALKFSPVGTRILVGLELSNEEAHYRVEDQGPGIEPEGLPYLFDRYWQGNQKSQLKQRRSSVGLGLYITKGIIEAHGGRINVESIVGVGTTFHVYLPQARVVGDSPTLSRGLPRLSATNSN